MLACTYMMTSVGLCDCSRCVCFSNRADVCVGVGHALVGLAGFWRCLWHYWKDLLQRVTWRQAAGCWTNTVFRRFILQGVNSASSFWQHWKKEGEEEGWFIYGARRGDEEFIYLTLKRVVMWECKGERCENKERKGEAWGKFKKGWLTFAVAALSC